MLRARALQLFIPIINVGPGVMSTGAKPPSRTSRQAMYQWSGLMWRAPWVLPSCVAKALNACGPLIHWQGAASALLRFAIMPPGPQGLDRLGNHARIGAADHGLIRKNDLRCLAWFKLEHTAAEGMPLEFATELHKFASPRREIAFRTRTLEAHAMH